jgi:hypothetical protein
LDAIENYLSESNIVEIAVKFKSIVRAMGFPDTK